MLHSSSRGLSIISLLSLCLFVNCESFTLCYFLLSIICETSSYIALDKIFKIMEPLKSTPLIHMKNLKVCILKKIKRLIIRTFLFNIEYSYKIGQPEL